MIRALSTSEVAKRVGVHPITLERWLAKNNEIGPKTLISGSRTIRLWTAKDVSRLKRYKAGRRRGRKPKVKQ